MQDAAVSTMCSLISTPEQLHKIRQLCHIDSESSIQSIIFIKPVLRFSHYPGHPRQVEFRWKSVPGFRLEIFFCLVQMAENCPMVSGNELSESLTRRVLKIDSFSCKFY